MLWKEQGKLHGLPWLDIPAGAPMQGETQPCNPLCSYVPLLGFGKLLAPTGTLVEGRKFCRKPELLSPPLPSPAGEAVSLTPFLWLLPGDSPHMSHTQWGCNAA